MDENYQSIISDLMNGTNFEVNSESKVLTSSDLRVETPIEVINLLLGGGLPLNGIYHTWGPPKGGKSTWLYQTMGIFQVEYPDGLCLIIDMESSSDPNRLLELGIDPSRVLRLPATSIESGFLSLFKVISNKIKNKKTKDLPMFVIWDTISHGLATDDSTQSRMNAQDRARIIKNYLPDLSNRIEKQPFILGLINQVIYETDRYGNRKANAGGGIALQHDNHMSVFITSNSNVYDSTGSLKIAQWSKLEIDKSKLSPQISNIPFKLDVTHGGYINKRSSFLWYMIDPMKFISTLDRGWYDLNPLYDYYKDSDPKIAEYVNSINKKYHSSDLEKIVESDDIFWNILRYTYINYISGIFSLQANIMKSNKDKIYKELMIALGVTNTEGEVLDSAEIDSTGGGNNESEITEQIDDN